jgi:ribosomal protein S18 acetylase RimI-like enzyme
MAISSSNFSFICFMTSVISPSDCSQRTIERLADIYNEAFSSDRLHLALYRPSFSNSPLSRKLRASLDFYKRRELHLYIVKREMVTLAFKEEGNIVGFVMFKVPKDYLGNLKQCRPDYVPISVVQRLLLRLRYSIELSMWFLLNPRIFRRKPSLEYAVRRAQEVPNIDNCIYIYHLAVRPEHQRKGIGKRLMEEVIAISNTVSRAEHGTDYSPVGSTSIMLETVHPDYYSRFGFHELSQFHFNDICVYIMRKGI